MREPEVSSKHIRALLKLKPTWGKGHFILGLLSYHLYLDSKDPYYLGVMDISAQSLEDIGYDKSAINILRLCFDFLSKNYEKINSISFDKELSQPDDWAVKYLDILRLELIGSSLMAEDKRAEAKSIFKKIHPERRSQEIRVAFMMFEALNPRS